MEARTIYEGALTIRQSEWLGDWWMIEKAEHEGQRGFLPTSYGSAFWCSERISDADVEGDGEQVRALATAILAGEAESFRRCAVQPDGDVVFFWSPRNSMTKAAVPRQRAEDLARLILATVPEPTATPAPTSEDE